MSSVHTGICARMNALASEAADPEESIKGNAASNALATAPTSPEPMATPNSATAADD